MKHLKLFGDEFNTITNRTLRPTVNNNSCSCHGCNERHIGVARVFWDLEHHYWYCSEECYLRHNND